MSYTLFTALHIKLSCGKKRCPVFICPQLIIFCLSCNFYKMKN